MKILFINLINILFFFNLNASENLSFYFIKAMDNNLQLNAERKKLESSKQERNISRSEFLLSITISGDQTSTTSTNKIDQDGANLADSKHRL